MRRIIAIFTIGFFLAFSAAHFTEAGILDDLKIQIDQKKQEIQGLMEQAAQYQDLVNQKQSEKKTLQNQLSVISAKISKLEYDIRISESRISQLNLEIEKLALEIQDREAEIESQKKRLGEIVRIIYELDQQSILELVLANDNFSDFLNQSRYLEDLQGDLSSKLALVKFLKNELENEKIDREIKRRDLEETKINLNNQRSITNIQKNERESLLKETKQEESRYQAILSDLEKQRDEIQKEIFEIEDKIRLTIDPESLPAKRPGVLSWPTEGRLTQGYGPTANTGFRNHVYSFHNGLDIASGYGAPIRAAEDGVVKATGDLGKYAYGKWVAIEHNNNLTTLYAHLSLQAVQNGQKVVNGQIIGYEGSTGFSTGSHLHFTVYASNTFLTSERWYGLLPIGGHINPRDYLP